MLMLIATKETQGTRKNDFSWTEEGELVRFGSACDGEHHADGPCGCRRALSGLTSHRGTTTVKVANIEKEGLVAAYHKSYQDCGFTILTPADAQAEVAELHRIAASFDKGTVLEYRNGTFRARTKEVKTILSH